MVVMARLVSSEEAFPGPLPSRIGLQGAQLTSERAWTRSPWGFQAPKVATGLAIKTAVALERKEAALAALRQDPAARTDAEIIAIGDWIMQVWFERPPTSSPITALCRLITSWHPSLALGVLSGHKMKLSVQNSWARTPSPFRRARWAVRLTANRYFCSGWARTLAFLRVQYGVQLLRPRTRIVIRDVALVRWV